MCPTQVKDFVVKNIPDIRSSYKLVDYDVRKEYFTVKVDNEEINFFHRDGEIQNKYGEPQSEGCLKEMWDYVVFSTKHPELFKATEPKTYKYWRLPWE